MLCNAFKDLTHYLSSCQSCLATTDSVALTTYNSTYLTPYLSYCNIPEVIARNATSTTVGSPKQTLVLSSGLPNSTSVITVPSQTPDIELKEDKLSLWKVVIPAVIFLLIGASLAFFLWRRWSKRRAAKAAADEQQQVDKVEAFKHPMELEADVGVVYEMEGDSAVELSCKEIEVHEMEVKDGYQHDEKKGKM